ncbi:MAG TPA: AmmeMemoRadiSam system protein A [Candidatus Limnocylindrales bacterium]|nr:AmmeMemoRadiSam system protein A [Candidatus Limnocylindrales bacterium]
MTTTATQNGRTATAGPVTPDVPVELREDLLEIARAAIQVAVGLASGWSLASRIRHAHPTELRSAVFVTLTDAGELRGCMGTLDPEQPVAQAVAAAAMTATLDDPRFYPVEADELADLDVDVSILGVPAELAAATDFVPGLDGIVVERGRRLGLLLPEVATDHGWDGERMLGAVCRKAGLPGDAWREPETRCLVFRTVRFGGRVIEGPPAR